MGRVYKRGAKWYVDYTVNGKRFRRSIGDSEALTEKDAERILARREGEALLADLYFELVRKFPLRPICSKVDGARATRLVAALTKRKLDPAERDYLEVLNLLVERYENGIAARRTTRGKHIRTKDSDSRHRTT